MSHGSPWHHRLGEAVDKCLTPLENVAAVIAGLMLLATMALATVDALLRYIFGTPLSFQFYLTGNYLMVGLTTMALGWGFRTGGYIRVGLLTDQFPQSLRHVLYRAGLAVSAVYVAVLAWKSGQYFIKAYVDGLVVVEEYNWPVAWSWVWIPIGCGLLALRVAVTALGPSENLELAHDPEKDL